MLYCYKYIVCCGLFSFLDNYHLFIWIKWFKKAIKFKEWGRKKGILCGEKTENRDEKQALKMFEIEKIAKVLHRFIASENDFYISKIGKWN